MQTVLGFKFGLAPYKVHMLVVHAYQVQASAVKRWHEMMATMAKYHVAVNGSGNVGDRTRQQLTISRHSH